MKAKNFITKKAFCMILFRYLQYHVIDMMEKPFANVKNSKQDLNICYA